MTSVSSQSAPQTIHCHDCGLVHQVVPIASGQKARCTRCGAGLYGHERDNLDIPLALAIAGAILFICANSFPFMSFEMEGRAQSNNLITGAIDFWSAGYFGLSVLVFLASIGLPALSLGFIIYVLGGLRSGRTLRGAPLLVRGIVALRPWAMMEVYLLGVIVAIVKLSDFAEIGLGPGFYAFITLILVVSAANATLHPSVIWRRMPKSEPLDGPPIGDCHHCGHPVPSLVNGDHNRHCPRCHAKFYHRKPNSLSRAWALLIAATICYIPANVYPIMTVISFGQGAPDTILSGVVHLVEASQWAIALLVFFASIFVPILKIGILGYLLVSVQFAHQAGPRQRTVAYRITEFIGRWSMIDIFMISILVALVKLDAIATIEAGPGAVAFAAVVVLTMLSAMSFDPRLIWDRIEDGHEQQ